MSDRKGWMSFACVAILLFCVRIGMAKEMSLAELESDPVEQLITNYHKQIGNLRCQFDVLEAGNPLLHVALEWDKARDSYKATRSYYLGAGERPNTRTWVLNDSREWSARPEHDGPTTGAWDVKVSPAGQGILPREVNLGEYRVTCLRQAFVPYMVRHGTTDVLKDNQATVDVTEAFDETGLVNRTYMFFLDGKKAATVTYILDRTDGLRMHKSVVTDYLQSDAPVILFVGEYKDFQKSNGLWIPREIKEAEFNPLNKQMEDIYHLRFTSVEVNVQFGADDFIYQPPYGSLVTDTNTGLMYRAGFQNPLAIATPDDLSLANVKPLSSNTAAEDQIPASNPSPRDRVKNSSWQSEPIASESDSRCHVLVVSIGVTVVILAIGAATWIRRGRRHAGA